MFKISATLVLLLVPAILGGTVSLAGKELSKERAQEVLEAAEDYVGISAASLNCNLGYACFQNRHYYFETKTKRTRDDAAKFCRAINMSLISVDDCEENTFVTNLIKNNECYKNYFWTAGYRGDTDAWYWGAGDTMTYTNWMRAEPNFGKNQLCVAYHSSYVQWSDEVCSNKYYFICESNNACA